MEKSFTIENIDFLQSIQATKEPLNATPITLTVSSYSFYMEKKQISKTSCWKIEILAWKVPYCRCSTDKIEKKERFPLLRSISIYFVGIKSNRFLRHKKQMAGCDTVKKKNHSTLNILKGEFLFTKGLRVEQGVDCFITHGGWYFFPVGVMGCRRRGFIVYSTTTIGPQFWSS